MLTDKNRILALEKVVEDQSKTIKAIREVLNENPYPTDIFPIVTTKQLNDIHEMLLKEFGFPLDRLSGHIGRVLRKGLSEQISHISD